MEDRAELRNLGAVGHPALAILPKTRAAMPSHSSPGGGGEAAKRLARSKWHVRGSSTVPSDSFATAFKAAVI